METVIELVTVYYIVDVVLFPFRKVDDSPERTVLGSDAYVQHSTWLLWPSKMTGYLHIHWNCYVMKMSLNHYSLWELKCLAVLGKDLAALFYIASVLLYFVLSADSTHDYFGTIKKKKCVGREVSQIQRDYHWRYMRSWSFTICVLICKLICS